MRQTPQPIAQQACSNYMPSHLILLQAWKQQANGIGEEEEVEMASAEVSTAAYASLLTVVVALFLYLGYRVWTGFQDSDPNIPWLSLVGFALTGFAVYEGASNLAIYNYVNTVQRPQSRVCPNCQYPNT